MRPLTMLTLSIAGAVTVALAGCASSSVSVADQQQRQQALAASDHLIVPGERIGPIRLGMGMDEVTATLGKPDYVHLNEYPGGKNDYDWRYWSLNLEIIFPQATAPSVTSISTVYWTGLPINARFSTANGIGLGSSTFEVVRAFNPSPYDDVGGALDYHRLGIFFAANMDGDHKVWRISIGPPR